MNGSSLLDSENHRAYSGGSTLDSVQNIAYSRGKDRFDNKPDQRVAFGFETFAEKVWADKSAEKGLAYICSPMFKGLHNDLLKWEGEEHWRLKHLAGRRCWQPFDIDYLEGSQALLELLEHLKCYQGIAYTTASSTDELPRVRVILMTNREMKYEESIQIGQAIDIEIAKHMDVRIKFDRSVYRGEQPCYLPTIGSIRYDLEGLPLDVDALLAELALLPIETIKTEISPDVRKPESYENWIQELLTGENVHDGAMRVVGRLVSEGATNQTIWTFFRLAADQIANNRDDRRVWELLDRGELKRLIDGARSKGFAPNKESEFVLKPVAEFVSEGFSDAWYIDEVIPKAGLGMIFGQSGSGKSFIAIDMMTSIAMGSKWFGLETEKAKIVYVAAEGAGGVKKRFLAQEVSGRVNLSSLDIQIVDVAPNFLRDDDVNLAKAIEAAGGADIVVVDTLAQTTPGGNENSSEDMGAALSRCKRLHETTGAMVILIHHSGKDSSKGARGWSGIRGALDFEIEVCKSAMCRVAKVTKQKDGDDSALFYFDLKPVTIGQRGMKSITSCVIEETIQKIEPARLLPKGEWQKRIWDFVQQERDAGRVGSMKNGKHHTLSTARVVDHIKANTVATGDKDRRRDNILRAINNLADAGFFSFENGEIWFKQESLEVFDEDISAPD